jgi:integrase
LLLAYCFPRTSELIEAPWTEFDLDRARWDIPAERMKMDTPHIIPPVFPPWALLLHGRSDYARPPDGLVHK